MKRGFNNINAKILQPTSKGFKIHTRFDKISMTKKASDDYGFGWMKTGVVDYSEFPAINYFIQRHGIYPSFITIAKTVNYADFVKKAKKIKCDLFTEYVNDTAFFNKTMQRLEYHGKYQPEFMCIEPKEPAGLLLYIVLEKMRISDAVGSEIKITCLYHPKKKHEDVLALVNEKYFNLPSLVTEEKETGFLNVMIKDESGFNLSRNPIALPVVDFEINYNADFKPVHELILQRLTENSKGLVLLHGLAGTGKTTYLRYLTHQLKKRVIFIPPNLTNAISDPAIIRFFMNYPNSIFVIEDAENVLTRRAEGASQAVANILNLTDGLMSDVLNIQIIATFNSPLLKIDDALLRKGRLIAKYEFKQLSPDRVEKLSKKVGVELQGKHTLADIYNANDRGFTEEKKQIGFQTR